MFSNIHAFQAEGLTLSIELIWLRSPDTFLSMKATIFACSGLKSSFVNVTKVRTYHSVIGSCDSHHMSLETHMRAKSIMSMPFFFTYVLVSL